MRLIEIFESTKPINKIVWRKRGNDIEKRYEKAPVITNRRRVELKDNNAK